MSENMISFNSTFEYKLIYVFRINDSNHKGVLKIGDATIHTNKHYTKLTPNSNDLNYAARNRIDSYTATAGIPYELLYTEVAVYEVTEQNSKHYGKVRAFRDLTVHTVLEKSGIKRKFFDTNKKQNEWFETDLVTVISAIKAVKEGKTAIDKVVISENKNPIIFRPEQKEAIKRTIQRYKTSNEMLWNAKMRFGKTLTALQVVKEMQFDKTIIITHRPVVSEGWYEDFEKIFFDRSNYSFASKTHGKSINELLVEKQSFVYFASMQDLRGSDIVGGNFDKNKEIFSIDWDFVVVDEAHEGTQTKLGKEVLDRIIKADNDHTTKVLNLSGTPFNLRFDEENIYTWDYIMEQEAKEKWYLEHFGDSNPYEELPKMNIFTYHLEKYLTGFVDVEEKAFNFREFFRTWTGDKNKDFDTMPKSAKVGDFVHEDAIISFLNLICKEDKTTNYPFSTLEYRDYFRHSLWMVPGVKEAKALSKILKKHQVFKYFEIVNVAGEGDDEIDSSDALAAVKKAISTNPDETYTITISCGRLTTGVSVPEWTAVLMLAGTYSTSAQQYLQTIFRVQTPANINGKIKNNSYVFDFAPDRTLKMVAELVQYSAKSGNKNPSSEALLGRFLNFCPVISIDESSMKEYKVSELLQELKKAYAERVVNNGFDDSKLYNDELLKLDDLDIKQFDELKKIVGSSKQSKSVNDVEINDQGFTDEEYEKFKKLEKKKKRELTEEEKKLLEELKKKKENRDKAISILRGISIRIPLMVYGINRDIDVDITVDNFADPDLIDDLSWEEFMPSGVTRELFKKFSKYYDKEVFIAASRRIRYISKTADSLEPTERVKKIALLFSTFKNPDKETVLTPWRVVNMHLSSTLGGYSFFDESFEYEVNEPIFIDKGEVTQNIFSKSNPTILEINSKTGLYPLYMVYSIYRVKCEKYSIDELTFEKKLSIWDDTVQNNMFVICKTPMAKCITKRTLIGYRETKANTRYFDDLVNQFRQKHKLDNLITKVSKGKSYWHRKEKGDNMKFDAIIGNPPYQIMDGGAQSSAMPVYNYFVDAAKKINPNYLSMIMPARWYAGGKGLDEFRENMLNDKRISLLYDFPNSADCFPSLGNRSIKGGICYFLWEQNHNKECTIITMQDSKPVSVSKRYLKTSDCDIFIRDGLGVSILNKVKSFNENAFSSIVSSRKPFDLPTNFTNFDKLRKDEKQIIIYAFRSQGFIDREKITKNVEWIDKLKLFIPEAIGNADVSKDKLKTIFGDKGTCCTETYLVIGPFVTKEELDNCNSYINTKFFHYLLSLKKITQHTTQKCYDFIPLQNFNEKWNDDKLYNKYGFSAEEIRYIENLVWPTNDSVSDDKE